MVRTAQVNKLQYFPTVSGFLPRHTTQMPTDRPFSAIRNNPFNSFETTLHIYTSSIPSALCG